MMHMLMGLAIVLIALPATAGTTYTVTTDADSGPGSLRECIQQANVTGLGDTITFQQAMLIEPTSALPAMTGNNDTIDGDLNDDGNPEVLLSGAHVPYPSANGLVIESAGDSAGAAAAGALLLPFPWPILTGNRIIGLCIQDFPSCGIWVFGRGGNTIRSCYIGVTWFGDGARPNGIHGILLQYSDGNTIGGTSPKDRNLIVGNASPDGNGYAGLAIGHGNGNRVLGNYFGLEWSGQSAIGHGGWHVGVTFGENNRIGSPDAGARNLFGGAVAGAGNVFGAASEGVHFADAGTADNMLKGNSFGSNAAGTAQRALPKAVRVVSGAGMQTIGPDNHFTPSGATGRAVTIAGGAGPESVVTGNSFGVLPAGTAVGTYCGLSIAQVRVFVTDNVFAQCESGVKTVSLGANARIFRNTFRSCQKAVWVQSGCAMLGNLGNSQTTDDGGNRFKASNTWHIYNGTESGLRAEGNDFVTTSMSAIDARIYDELDNPNRGRVDFVPLAGGVIPTGAGLSPALRLASVSATPTPLGSELIFALSAPANLTAVALNLAGRPVATLRHDAPTAAGLQRVVWTGRSDMGIAVPAGRYLARITARNAEGEEAGALVTVSLRR